MNLLDTDILTLLIEGHAKTTANANRALRTDPMAISIVTRVEALRGRFDFLLKADSREQWLRAQELLVRWETELTKYRVVFIDDRAADEFDRLIRSKSIRKIGRADLLIASIALANRATLVTRNLKHFRLVPGLKCENWAD